MTQLLVDSKAVEELRRECLGAEVIIDFETKGLDPHSPESYIAGAAIKPRGGVARYLSLRHPNSVNWGRDVLRGIWAAAKTISNHNRRFDLKMAHCCEGLPLKPGRDTMTDMSLENENRLGPKGTRKGAYMLKPWCAQQFGPDAVAAEAELTEKMLARGYDPKIDLYRLEAREIAAYACADADLVERVLDYTDGRFRSLGLEALSGEYAEFDQLILRMELDGLQLDRALIEQYLDEARQKERELRRTIQEKAHIETGWEFEEINPASPLQMRLWLGTESTESWQLRFSKDQNAHLLLAWRRWAKAVGTYYEPYLERSTPAGVLYPSFWYTRTGRLTCFKPNLHATPHYGPEYKMKDCFVAPPGHFLLYADWSQAEMRLCAHYTQDPDLIRWFAEGKDIHAMVAESLKLLRDNAKQLNYGSAYGLGHARLAREYGIDPVDAKKWLRDYHERIKGPRTLYRRMNSLAEERGWIRLMDGRYRRFTNDPAVGSFPHSASNSLLQGGVGVIARRASLQLAPWCYENGGKIWIQIHDAILLCLPDALRTPATFRYVRSVMERTDFRVPMPVTMGVGNTWRRASETTPILTADNL